MAWRWTRYVDLHWIKTWTCTKNFLNFRFVGQSYFLIYEACICDKWNGLPVDVVNFQEFCFLRVNYIFVVFEWLSIKTNPPGPFFFGPAGLILEHSVGCLLLYLRKVSKKFCSIFVLWVRKSFLWNMCVCVCAVIQ